MYLQNSLKLIAYYFLVVATMLEPATNTKLATVPKLCATNSTIQNDSDYLSQPKILLHALTQTPYETNTAVTLEENSVSTGICYCRLNL